MTRPSFRRPRPSALRLEHLEDRTVPAGNVTASVLTDPDGFRTLILRGDTADNRVTLQQMPNGLVQVHGITTTINGGKGVTSFANVHGLAASFSTGNNTVCTMNLNMQTVSLDGGFGDDNLVMLNTTLADGLREASLVVTGDPESTRVPPDTLVNGRDRIELVGTRMSSSEQYAPITILGNSVVDLDTPDDIRLTDTRLTFHSAGDHTAYIYGGYHGESRGAAGDVITVSDFQSVGGGEYTYSGLYVQGSSGDDTIRFTGIDLTYVGTGGLNFANLDVIGTGGFDRLDATGVTITATGPADSYQYFLSAFSCEDVRFRDWDVAVTSQLDFGFGLLPFQPSFRGVHNLELRDVRMTTPEGGGNIRIDQIDPDTGEVGFATNILLDNVQIDQEVESPFGLGFFYDSYSGDDTIRIRNSRMPNFEVFGFGGSSDGSSDVLIEGSELGGLGLTLGFANDTVRIWNSTIRDTATLLTLDGDDTIQVGDSMFGGRFTVEGGAGDNGVKIHNSAADSIAVFLGDGNDELWIRGATARDLVVYGDDGGGGNDEMNILNCAFDTLTSDLGDGDDTAALIHNTATVSIAVDGGSGFDTLFVWGNIAPDFFFDGFEG